MVTLHEMPLFHKRQCTCRHLQAYDHFESIVAGELGDAGAAGTRGSSHPRVAAAMLP